jgi:two-component system, NtrC family, nitrogen regulation response regulator NtrX
MEVRQSARAVFTGDVMSLILVVEDDEHFRNIIGEILELEGYDVSLTGSALEAVRFCQERTPDLVITDLLMPKMDGFELIRSLRQSHPNLPVLAISGASNKLLKEAIELGAVGSLQKPFREEELLALVARILKEGRLAYEQGLELWGSDRKRKKAATGQKSPPAQKGNST